jgi:hypothetical protein
LADACGEEETVVTAGTAGAAGLLISNSTGKWRMTRSSADDDDDMDGG